MMNANKFFVKVKQLLQHTVFQVLLFVILALASYSVMFTNVTPERIEVEPLQVADQTILSPKTVEDVEKTEEERQEVLKNVTDVYTLKKEYKENRVDLISSIYDAAIEVKKEVSENDGNGSDELTEEQIKNEKNVQIQRLKDKLTANVNKDLSDNVYQGLIDSSAIELGIAKDNALTAINKVMSISIAADGVAAAKENVVEELRYLSLNANLKAATIELASYAITQNYFYDPEKTEEARQKAIDSVDPVLILQGQVLVEKGDFVTNDIYRNLELVGLLNNEVSFIPHIGLIILVGLVFLGVFYNYRMFEVKNEHKHSFILIFSIVFLISIATFKIISLLDVLDSTYLSFFIPAAMGPMIIKILLNDRHAIVLTIILSLFGSVIFNNSATSVFNMPVGVYVLLSGLVAILLLNKGQLRSKLFQTGILLSVVHIVIILSLVFIMDMQISNFDYVLYIIAALTSGMTASILTIGLLPFFEAGFGILSSMKLIELSNPNHPLLRKILTEAPGTYHHSIMVANLAETACEAINANGLLARVGCYYHDIGKTRRPQFFIENQMNTENPHDKLNPITSRDIIIAHVSDGAKILRKHKMPKEIVDIAEQHHGTTSLKFFYHKAKELDSAICEKDFRYPGPKAQTKESAIIGIADSVEAAVRSMKHPTKEKIENLVRSIIHSRINDDQFSECDITMKELYIVEKTLCETLNGIFHSRIEYPDGKNESKNESK